MRAEVEAPFRTARMFLLGFFTISASVASLVATSQLIGAVGGAPNAKPLEECLQTLAIDLGSVGVLVLLLRKDWSDRSKQMLRMGREERLAACQVELTNGKTLQLGRLRSFCRPVIFAGTPAQVEAACAAAQPYKEELLRRGVFLIPLPVFSGEASSLGTDGGDASVGGGGTSEPREIKWEGRAIRTDEWKAWFTEQAGAANANVEKGLYVGLRLDGRVRASGTGIPPWGIFAKQLAPMEGIWKGVLDGMDGRVGG